MKINFKDVSQKTIARVVILALTILNAILKMCGLVPVEIEQAEIYNLVTQISVIAVPLWNAWKNNSATIEAQGADKIMKILRTNTKKNAIEQINTVLNDYFEESEGK